MLYHLIGELVLATPGTAVIDCGGVGYRLSISGTTLGKLAAEKDTSRVRLFTHMSVREDAVELFGFYEMEELTAFKMLIGVSGVGPKAAMAILSVLSPDQLALAVSSEDAKRIAQAQGVGKKIAERIVLELKDKMAKELPVSQDGGEAAVTASTDEARTALAEAMETLTVLGYSRSEVSYALRGFDAEGLGVEEIVRAALKKLMK